MRPSPILTSLRKRERVLTVYLSFLQNQASPMNSWPGLMSGSGPRPAVNERSPFRRSGGSVSGLGVGQSEPGLWGSISLGRQPTGSWNESSATPSPPPQHHPKGGDLPQGASLTSDGPSVRRMG
jgi:hypothetical protein